VTGPRKHLARRSYNRDGLAIACHCGQYQPIKGTVREQEDAHRAHRVAMGETVKPRTPSRLERAEARITDALTECDAIEAEQHGQHDEDADGMREAVRRIRAALTGDRDG